MELNAEQTSAVELAQWCAAAPRRIGVVSGPAGSGKTTCLRQIHEALKGNVVLAPTNRAASRAQQASGHPAQTIHSYIYTPYQNDDTVRFRRRIGISRPKSGLIVVDESSMLGQDILLDLWTLLSELDVSFLFIGDSYQLPPFSTTEVDGELEFSVFNETFDRFVSDDNSIELRRVALTSVMRQALESPVLRGATHISANMHDWEAVLSVIESREYPKVGNVPIRLNAMREDAIDHACIVYTNETRHRLNRETRALRGLDSTAEPQPGEPLLVRRNCRKLGISNGEIITFDGFMLNEPVGMPKGWRFTKVNGISALLSMDEILRNIAPDPTQLRGLRWPFIQANLGYAMTCHAAQGSEFDWVVLYWDRSILGMPMPYRSRWLYTAFSRAKEKLMIGGL